MMGYVASAMIFLGLMFIGLITAAAFDLME
jgi:hypothetical protein